MATTSPQAAKPVHIDGTLRLTTPIERVKITVGNKEKHGLGASKTVHHCTRMDATRATKEERQALSLRNQARRSELASTKLEVHCTCFQAGSNERAGDTSNPEQVGDSPKNDFGPSTGGNLLDGP
jgi:hypothetical protein